MDPYLERQPIWADFHDSLIIAIRGLLQPLLRPRYVALTQDRLYVVESERPVYPDVSVVRTSDRAQQTLGTTALLEEVDAPVVFDLDREEIRQPLIHIIEPAAGNRIVTAIEILSPDNKLPGPGRDSYLRKRDEFWNSGTNLVEIDLLRAGEPTVRVSPARLARLRPWHYLVAVTRHQPSKQAIYPVSLQRRLPRVAIPLAANDNDVILELQAALTRCWNEGPYPELLRYQSDPTGPFSPEEIAWCAKLLAEAGVRTTRREPNPTT
jgi:hypothetical protein